MDIKKLMRNPLTFLFIVLIVAAILMFLNLGQRFYWSDEHPAPLLARNILKYGYPRAFDGKYYAQNYYYDNYPIYPTSLIFNNNYTWIYQPWLNYYITAAGFSIFGDNEFGGRFFNALLGLGTIVLFYFLARRLTKDNATTMIATVLLATSVTLYLYSRTVRYYALVMFFSVAVFLSYTKLIQEKKGYHWLVLSSVFLYYSNVTVFFPVMLAIVLHYFLFFKNWKKLISGFILSLGGIACFTVPWFVYAQLWKNTNDVTLSIKFFPLNILSSYYFITLLWFPLLLLFFLPMLLKRYDKDSAGRDGLFTILFFLCVYLVFVSIFSLPAPVRYLLPIMPFFYILTAMVIIQVAKWSKYVAVLGILVLIFTSYLHVFPYVFLKPALKSIHSPYIQDQDYFWGNSLKIRYDLSNYLYEITHDYESTDESVIRYLKENARDSDTILSNDQMLMIVYGNWTILRLNDFYKQPPNWIIIRYNSKQFIDFISQRFDLKQYEKIEIHNKDTYWSDDPNPLHHRYVTDTTGLVVIYRYKG